MTVECEEPNIWIHECVDCHAKWWPGQQWPALQICRCGGMVAGHKQDVPAGIMWTGDERKLVLDTEMREYGDEPEWYVELDYNCRRYVYGLARQLKRQGYMVPVS